MQVRVREGILIYTPSLIRHYPTTSQPYYLSTPLLLYPSKQVLLVAGQ